MGLARPLPVTCQHRARRKQATEPDFISISPCTYIYMRCTETTKHAIFRQPHVAPSICPSLTHSSPLAHHHLFFGLLFRMDAKWTRAGGASGFDLAAAQANATQRNATQAEQGKGRKRHKALGMRWLAAETRREWLERGKRTMESCSSEGRNRQALQLVLRFYTPAAIPPGLTSHISCGLRLFAIIESDEPTTHIDLHLLHPL